VTPHILLVIILLVLALVCFFFAWRSGREDARLLEQLGRTYNCRRWPGETNNQYRQRIRNRIGWGG
jgi:protein-S-isoprenylcysteine O-methyltransferase Ste14